MLKFFLKNPITLWLHWWFNTLALKLKYSSNNIHIGYLSSIKGCTFDQFNSIAEGVTLRNVKLGFASYIARNSRLKDVEIGKFCSIGPNVMVNQGEHPSTGFVSTHPAFYSSGKQAGFSFTSEDLFEEYGPVKIGNDVWIGANTLIRPGVTIGNGAIIAAGAIVTKDVEAYSIVGGIPAKFIRFRFSQEEIRQLKLAEWWNWDLEKLKKESKNFVSIGSFINQLGVKGFALKN